MSETTTAVEALQAWIRAISAASSDQRLGTPGRDGWLSEIPPFTFRYGGRDARELLPRWRQSASDLEQPDGVRIRRLSWIDPATDLEVVWEAKTYSDLPVAE